MGKRKRRATKEGAKRMTHGSLFSGEGGFDLAAECPDGIDYPSMGWTNLFHCEWNIFCQRILNYYWPKSICYDDIRKTDFTIWRGRIDVLTGGFPCQPYSIAGKQQGKDDERHLWPEMLRAIKEIQPRWIVGENVLNLVNWNGGMVFDEVQADLETAFKDSEEAKSLGQLGYEVFPYVLPAAGVNAPHERYRVWFVAHRNNGFGTTTSREGNVANSKGLRIDRTQEHEDDNRQSGERGRCDAHNSIEISRRKTTSDTKGSNAKRREQPGNKERTYSEEIGGGLRNEPECDGSDGIDSNPTSDGCTDGCTKTGGTLGESKKGRMQQSQGIRSEQYGQIDSDTELKRFIQPEQQGQSRCKEGLSEGVCDNGITSDTGSDGLQSGGFRESRPAQSESKGKGNKRKRIRGDIGGISEQENIADTERKGLEKPQQSEQRNILLNAERNNTQDVNAADTSAEYAQGNRTIGERISGIHAGEGQPERNSARYDWSEWPTQSPLCSGNDEFSPGLDFTTVFKSYGIFLTDIKGQQKRITFSKWVNESLKAHGNAIVVKVALQIFKAIEAYEKLNLYLQ